MNSALTAEAAAALEEGINLVLSRWTAFRMAVENEWGGRDSLQKSQKLGSHLFLLLSQSKEKVYIDDVENLLDEFMLNLNTVIEDGSIEEVAEKLMIMHEECSEGNFDSVNRLKEAKAPIVSYVKKPANDNEDDSGEDEEDDDEIAIKGDEACEMEVDEPQSRINGGSTEDGWTVVASKNNRRRRN
ncbi:hypothetical protein M569_10404 [Genlisea aurea]|uniref:Pre-rRNA-processing protein TSR2 n=1 Tax=Genlisea aurea TaxID=192259 RepID=S8CBT1_9LAMI|nr:hypothetical protein M569_10404 [Genlisea aurea]